MGSVRRMNRKGARIRFEGMVVDMNGLRLTLVCVVCVCMWCRLTCSFEEITR